MTETATFCATLVDQWQELGVTAAFVAPGSRSTPLALALADNSAISVNVFHDERSASFAALGHGLATKAPAVLLCTSGTAAAHFHAAIIEADIACVPMLVCTADRPPELWDVGAPQTINQTRLYGDAVRDFLEPGPPEECDPAGWRSLAFVSHHNATGPRPGPVHLNLSFREPLVGLPGPLPERTDGVKAASGATVIQSSSELAVSRFAATQLVAECLDNHGIPKKGVIIAGRGQSTPAAVTRFAELLGWPILADHRSGCRSSPLAVTHFDGLLRNQEFALSHRPEVAIRLGELLASKSTSQWIVSINDGTQVCKTIAAMPWGRHIDPEGVRPLYLPQYNLIEAAVDHLEGVLNSAEPRTSSWIRSWMDANSRAEEAITFTLASHGEISEPEIARESLKCVPNGGALVLSSSMPVRDVEWYGENHLGIDVYANRGANGIDGITSTAVGIALTNIPTVCLIGDIAFLHDSGALIGLANRSLDLTIVITDNDGGGIFSFLPQHEMLAPDRYEDLFGTPHGTDLTALAQAHGISHERWSKETAMAPLVSRGSGLKIVVAKTDRASNLTLHEQLNTAVSDSLT